MPLKLNSSAMPLNRPRVLARAVRRKDPNPMGETHIMVDDSIHIFFT